MQNSIPGALSRPAADMMNRTLEQFEARVRSAGGTSSRQGKEELEKVAHDFESLFVSYLLKVMRETIDEAGAAEEGYGKTIYTELFDEEMARTIARQGTFGIADLLMNRLSNDGSTAAGESLPGKPQSPVAAPSSTPAPSVPETDSGSGSDISDIHLPLRAPVSSEFGIRRDPFTRQLRFHKGLDLAAPIGTEVRAALGGEVVFAGFKAGYGNTVIIEHPEGLETIYAHLDEVNVKKGEAIDSDSVLGIVGHSGRSTGPHLHFEVSRWGEPVDPRNAMAE